MPIDINLDTLSDTPVGDVKNLQTDNPIWRATFSLASTSNLNAVLDVDSQSEGGDANFREYQNTNNNGEFDSSIDLSPGALNPHKGVRFYSLPLTSDTFIVKFCKFMHYF